MMKRVLVPLLAAASLSSALAFAAAPAPFPPSADDPPTATRAAPAVGAGKHRGRDGMHGRHGHGDPAAREARRAVFEKLTTPEERTAFRDKMRSAAPEQRRELAHGDYLFIGQQLLRVEQTN
jgi:hypothetical protein